MDSGAKFRSFPVRVFSFLSFFSLITVIIILFLFFYFLAEVVANLY